MIDLVIVCLFSGLLYFWLIGNAATVPFVAIGLFWLAQMALQSPADTGFDIAFRALWVFLLAGIPTCVWGDLARWNVERRQRQHFAESYEHKPYRIYVELPPEDYSEYQ